jgi:hypothetical protein
MWIWIRIQPIKINADQCGPGSETMEKYMVEIKPGKRNTSQSSTVSPNSLGIMFVLPRQATFQYRDSEVPFVVRAKTKDNFQECLHRLINQL